MTLFSTNHIKTNNKMNKSLLFVLIVSIFISGVVCRTNILQELEEFTETEAKQDPNTEENIVLRLREDKSLKLAPKRSTLGVTKLSKRTYHQFIKKSKTPFVLVWFYADWVNF